MTTDYRHRGAILALASALLFGASTPFAKLLIGEVSPWVLAGLLYLGSGLGLGIVELVRRTRGRVAGAELEPSEWPWFAGAVVAGGIVGPVLLMLGLARLPASNAALLLNLETVFTAAVAWVVFRENVDRRIAAGMFLIAIGATALSWTRDARGDFGIGVAFVVGACLAWALDNNLMRRVAHGDAVRLAAIKGGVAGFINLAIAWISGLSLPDLAAVPVALGLGFVGYGLSLVLFVLALRDLGTARTGAYFACAPFAGALIAILVLGETATLLLAVAAALMGVGVYFHVTERHEHDHEHQPTEHSHRHSHDEHHRHEHVPSDPPGEPHVHRHAHARLRHRHAHFPDAHHRQRH